MVKYVFLRNDKADDSFMLLVAIENKIKELVKEMLVFAIENQSNPETIEKKIRTSMVTLACTILMENGYCVDLDENLNLVAKKGD